MGIKTAINTAVSHLIVGGRTMIEQAIFTGQDVRTQCGVTANVNELVHGKPCPMCHLEVDAA